MLYVCNKTEKKANSNLCLVSATGELFVARLSRTIFSFSNCFDYNSHFLYSFYLPKGLFNFGGLPQQSAGKNIYVSYQNSNFPTEHFGESL